MQYRRNSRGLLMRRRMRTAELSRGGVTLIAVPSQQPTMLLYHEQACDLQTSTTPPGRDPMLWYWEYVPTAPVQLRQANKALIEVVRNQNARAVLLA